MATPTLSKDLYESLTRAVAEARKRRHTYLTLEHLLLAMIPDRQARAVLVGCGANLSALERELTEHLDTELEALPLNKGEKEGAFGPEPEQTLAIQRVLQRSAAPTLQAEEALEETAVQRTPGKIIVDGEEEILQSPSREVRALGRDFRHGSQRDNTSMLDDQDLAA